MLKPAFASLLLPLCALLIGGCQPDTPNSRAAKPVLVIAAAPAATGSAVFHGEIRARHELDLAFRVGGRISARLVDAGAEVRPGQPLARLDPTDLQLAANAASAQLASAESDLATASAERSRYADLLSRRFVSQAAYEVRDNTYNAARARLEQARAQAALSGNQAAYGTLSSDFPAVVTAVLAEAGQVVGAGQPVLRIARPEEKEVAVNVPESRISEFRTSKSYTVRLWAEPELSLRGELRELSPAADPTTRSYAARIRLLDAPAKVHLGMTANVELGDKPAGDLLLPLAAVIDQGQGPLVKVVVDGRIASRPVRVAGFDERGLRIAGGLQAGEQVVVAGATRLAEGDEVSPRLQTPPEKQR